MRTVPNALAVIRAALVIPVIVLVAEPAHAWWALIVFCLAALTDAFDGPLARRLGAVTPLGAFLDPLADKILIVGTLIALLGQGRVEAWPVAVILGRESLAVALRSAGVMRGIAIEVTTYGKAKTVVQAVAVASVLLAVCVPAPEAATLAVTLLVAAVALTVASGADQLVRAPGLFVPSPERSAYVR